MNSLSDLENILQSELELYNRLYCMEQEKSDAIIDRDGSIIESLSRDQESLLEEIEGYEEKRKSLIDEYAKENHPDDISNDITLKKIASRINEDSSRRLIQTGLKLKSLLIKIKALQETNQKLLDDNIEFFSALMSGLRNSISESSYSETGIEELRVTDSLVLDKKI